MPDYDPDPKFIPDSDPILKKIISDPHNIASKTYRIWLKLIILFGWWDEGFYYKFLRGGKMSPPVAMDIIKKYFQLRQANPNYFQVAGPDLIAARVEINKAALVFFRLETKT